jgi:hypothetical protein
LSILLALQLLVNILAEGFAEERLFVLFREDWVAFDVVDVFNPWPGVGDTLFRSRLFKFENATVTVSIR